MRRAGLLLLVLLAGCGGGGDSNLGLRLADFPSGWQQYGADSKQVTCKSILAAQKAADHHEQSPQFEHPDGFVAGSTVYLYADEAKAREGFKSLASDTTGRCLVRSLGRAETAPLDVAAAGDESTGLRATLAATKDHPVAFYDLVFVRAGSAVTELIFAGVRKPFDPQLREQVTAKAAARLKTQGRDT